MRNTICQHLTRAIEAGAPHALAQFSLPEQQQIEPAYRKTGAQNLVGLRDALDGKYSVDELRIFRALGSAKIVVAMTVSATRARD